MDAENSADDLEDIGLSDSNHEEKYTEDEYRTTRVRPA
jgi:hypothetical protein